VITGYFGLERPTLAQTGFLKEGARAIKRYAVIVNEFGRGRDSNRTMSSSSICGRKFFFSPENNNGCIGCKVAGDPPYEFLAASDAWRKMGQHGWLSRGDDRGGWPHSQPVAQDIFCRSLSLEGGLFAPRDHSAPTLDVLTPLCRLVVQPRPHT